MRRDLLELLACPDDKAPLHLRVEREDGNEVLEGALECAQCGAAYPIRNAIPDLLPRDVSG